MEDGRISDSRITASTTQSEEYSTRNARLNGPSSWTARHNDPNQWIKVDLDSDKTITAIATQGRRDDWVKTFTVSYSSDGQRFEFKKIIGTEMVSFFDSVDSVMTQNLDGKYRVRGPENGRLQGRGHGISSRYDSNFRILIQQQFYKM